MLHVLLQRIMAEPTGPCPPTSSPLLAEGGVIANWKRITRKCLLLWEVNMVRALVERAVRRFRPGAILPYPDLP